MLLFFSILAIVVLFVILILLSDLNIVIDNLELTNIKEIICKPNKIRIEVLFLGKVKWFGYSFKKFKISKKINMSNIQKLYKKIEEKNNGLTNKQKIKPYLYIENSIIKLIKYSKTKRFKTEIIVDTVNVELLAYIIALVSTIIPNLIRKHIDDYNQEKFNFNIIPLFNNTNSIYIKLNCIFSIKIVHIINMLKLEKGRDKNERTSNRRFNANSNGKYKEYDRC